VPANFTNDGAKRQLQRPKFRLYALPLKNVPIFYPPGCIRLVDARPFLFKISDFSLIDHRITRSALASTLGGIGKPICLAVLD
jgi:hypothetical protein